MELPQFDVPYTGRTAVFLRPSEYLARNVVEVTHVNPH
jgi:hypothetical protein